MVQAALKRNAEKNVKVKQKVTESHRPIEDKVSWRLWSKFYFKMIPPCKVYIYLSSFHKMLFLLGLLMNITEHISKLKDHIARPVTFWTLAT